MVGAKGFEPSTSWSRTRRASQAALRPESYCILLNSLRGIASICNFCPPGTSEFANPFTESR